MRVLAVFLSIFLLAVTATLADATSAHAHTAITDTSRQYGAVLHISPDDDPVAGEPATIFFDTHGQLLRTPNTTVSATVTGNATTDTIQAEVQGDLATFTYTFPTVGVYHLRLTVSGEQSITFEYSQRITRGVTSQLQGKQQHLWAEALLTATGATATVIGIIMFHRRRKIMRQIDQQMLH